MCVIICIEDGKYPDYKTLKDAESLNSHGGSISWVDNGKISYHKGITAKKINEYINKKLKPSQVKTAVIHFRIASVGAVNQKLCHPFPISNTVSTKLKVMDSDHDLLFHNGTISNWEGMLIKAIQGRIAILPKGELSDSRVMAYLINEVGHEFLAKLVGNSFTILTKKGIIKYGGWVDVGDNKCSNDYFVKSRYYQNDDYFDKTDKEIDKRLITKKDYKLYNELVEDFYIDDYEILGYLKEGKTMGEIKEIIADTQISDKYYRDFEDINNSVSKDYNGYKSHKGYEY